MPDTRPDLHFDEDNICDACKSAKQKYEKINWEKRKEEFDELIKKISNKNNYKYDCLIPVSGGKDSHLTLHYAKNVYKLNPLCICFEPTLPTAIGRENLNNIR